MWGLPLSLLLCEIFLADFASAGQQCQLKLHSNILSSPFGGSTSLLGSTNTPAASTPLPTSVPSTRTASSSASASPTSTPFAYGTTPIRGVNLGGWFVLEPWITPSIFNNTGNANIIDEFTFGSMQDPKTALTTLTKHWETWITEADFIAIAAAGLNHVRIPLGYWSVPMTSDDTNENTSPTPYISGAWPYLLTALNWAKKHGIRVILDLHGAPGSQNGFDNSGQRTSNSQWAITPANITRTVDTLTYIVKHVGGLIDVIELLNEPATFLYPSTYPDTLRQFWQDGYDAVRAAVGPDIRVMIGDGFMGVDAWTNFMTYPSAQGVIMDYHEYQLFSVPELSRNFSEHIQFTCSSMADIDAFARNNIWAIVGEWSTAVTDCAVWLNGRNIGARWDGTWYTPNTPFGSCDGWSGDYHTFSAQYKTFLRQYWEVQTMMGEGVQGWVYWAWKVDDSLSYSRCTSTEHLLQAENADDWRSVLNLNVISSTDGGSVIRKDWKGAGFLKIRRIECILTSVPAEICARRSAILAWQQDVEQYGENRCPVLSMTSPRDRGKHINPWPCPLSHSHLWLWILFEMRQEKFAQNMLELDIDLEDYALEVRSMKETELTKEVLEVFIHAEPIGIAPGYSKEGDLVALAIADNTYCLIVSFISDRSASRSGITQKRGGGGDRSGRGPQKAGAAVDTSGRKLLEKLVLCRASGDNCAFDCGPLSMSLYCAVGLRIKNGIDIQSAFSSVNRKPLSAIEDAVGGTETVKVFAENITEAFQNPLYDSEDKHCSQDLVSRAWLSQYLPMVGNCVEAFAKVPKIDTEMLELPFLNHLAKLTQDTLRLRHSKPSNTKHSIMLTPSVDSEGSDLQSQGFKNRIRSGQNVEFKIQNAQGAVYTHRDRVGNVVGRRANLANSYDHLDNSKVVLTVHSIGRDDPTTAEARRALTVLHMLQGQHNLFSNNPWTKNIWLPSSDSAPGLLTWPDQWAQEAPVLCSVDNLGRHKNLNQSQQDAVDAMLSNKNDHHIVLVQGKPSPPGTGKTSVIATFVNAAVSMNYQGIWLVAKSNVAVINIALKLQSVGFLNWRLLASAEFSHKDWHGHLYDQIRDKFISSHEFSKMGRDYIPVITQYEKTLRKMCFIGDNKQLPPFGQEDLQDLQSIFEIPHLQSFCIFLDIQYRMPPQIGDFISQHVYDSKLSSNPMHPIPNSHIACQFINVVNSKEKLQVTSTSITNEKECAVVLQLSQHLQNHNKNFKIITPYDAQRELIQEALRSAGLHWEEKNISLTVSGNEEDVIIISLVRTRALGFLQNLRRTNVMLTRSKKHMYLVTSRNFVDGPLAHECLVGHLSRHVGDLGWLELSSLDNDAFLTNFQKQH
ncbi:unnamed protein product [Mycena citricolor]|uniref:glucan 1,3-beta-glucosidase n=1 Tax=Mycena citricolor TaxID=2018698 RepID=A0AAD2JZT1_9AGAR|nr:unnamed protein product [Mycena citricolor]